MSLPGRGLLLQSAMTCSITLLLIVLSPGCGATPASNTSSYDPKPQQKKGSELNDRMGGFLTGLANQPQPTYEEKKAFYDDYLIAVRSLMLSLRSPHNNSSLEKLQLIIEDVEKLAAHHQAGQLAGSRLIDLYRKIFVEHWYGFSLAQSMEQTF